MDYQGAEPIYLHVLRPLFKPYTPTLDLLLDFFCMIGDILFTLATIPVDLALSWYRSSMFYTDEVAESEGEGTRVDIANQTQRQPSQLPRMATPDRQSPQNPRPSGELSRGSSDTSNAKSVPSNGTPPERSHQIWYPPPSSYLDNEDDVNGGIGIHTVGTEYAFLSEAAKQEHEEWRQYPAFPSAYPPTPLVSAVSGLPSSAVQSTLSGILEDSFQQDFRGSLLPPHKPLNHGLSDDVTLRVQSDWSDAMSVDSETEDDEDEDAFNVTLKTPMVPLRKKRPRAAAARNLPDYRVSDAFSVRSYSTTLSTVDYGSSLRTRSSAESLASGVITTSDSPNMLGKKRRLPIDSPASLRRSVRILDGKTAVVDRSKKETETSAHAPPNQGILAVRPTALEGKQQRVDDDVESSMDFGDESSIGGRKTTTYAKKRRVIVTAGSPTRPIRTRVTRYATAPSRMQSTSSNIKRLPSRPNSRVPQARTDFIGPATATDDAMARANSAPSIATTRPGVKPKPRPKSQGVRRTEKK